MDQLVTVASFYSPIEANLFKLRLEENGIHAGLAGEGTTAGFGLSFNRIDVQVNESEADMAVRLLEQFEAESQHSDDEELPPEIDQAPSDAIQASHPDERSAHIRSTERAARVRTLPDDAQRILGTNQLDSAEDSFQTCPACKSKVDAGRETCHWCGASMKAEKGNELDEMPDEGDKEDPIVDDASLKSLETAEGDARAQRAFLLATGGFFISGLAAGFLFALSVILGPTLAILALLILPACHAISLVLVLLTHGQYKVSPRGKVKLYTALVADTIVLAAWLMGLFISVLQASGRFVAR
jgi:hypothetical protein